MLADSGSGKGFGREGPFEPISEGKDSLISRPLVFHGLERTLCFAEQFLAQVEFGFFELFQNLGIRLDVLFREIYGQVVTGLSGRFVRRPFDQDVFLLGRLFRLLFRQAIGRLAFVRFRFGMQFPSTYGFSFFLQFDSGVIRGQFIVRFGLLDACRGKSRVSSPSGSAAGSSLTGTSRPRSRSKPPASCRPVSIPRFGGRFHGRLFQDYLNRSLALFCKGQQGFVVGIDGAGLVQEILAGLLFSLVSEDGRQLDDLFDGLITLVLLAVNGYELLMRMDVVGDLS